MTTITIPAVRVPDLGPVWPVALSAAALTVACVALWRTRRTRDEPPLHVSLPELPEERERREERLHREDERRTRELALAERRLAFEEAREERLKAANGYAGPHPAPANSGD